MIKTRNAIRSFPALLYLHSDGPDDQAEAFDIGCDHLPQHFREGPFPGALQQLNFLSSGRETSVKPCLLRLVPKGSFHQLFLIGSWYHDESLLPHYLQVQFRDWPSLEGLPDSPGVRFLFSLRDARLLEVTRAVPIPAERAVHLQNVRLSNGCPE